MKTKNKIFLIISIILVFVLIYQINSTYAKYISARTEGYGNDIANWYIELQDEDILENKSISINKATIAIDEEESASSDKFFSDNIFAPGRYGYFDIKVDYSKVTVPFEYKVTAENNAGNNNIIEFITVIDGDVQHMKEEEKSQVDLDLKEDLEKARRSSVDTKNPLINQIDQNAEDRIKTVRVYIIWKEVSNTNTSNFADNSISGGNNILYDITFEFNQISEVKIEEDDPIVHEPLSINGREEIIEDNDNSTYISIGDKITLGTETFYVIGILDGDDDPTVKMLSAYNLNIGQNKIDDSATFGLQNPSCKGLIFQNSEHSKYTCTSEFYSRSDKLNIESVDENIEIVIDDNENSYEVRDFDDRYNGPAFEPPNIGYGMRSYWADSSSIKYPSMVFTTQSNLYDYVNNYEKYLKGLGYSSSTATLLSSDELTHILSLQGMACNGEDDECWNDYQNWLPGYSFWTNTATSSIKVIGYYRNNMREVDFYNNYSLGIRPVVSIKATDIRILK